MKMSNYILDENIDSEKCFILKRSELEKRIDPFYYTPSVRKLESDVLSQGAKPLRHFIKKVSSGATPKTVEKEKYYSDKENGIPFLRVQNLSPTGFLELDNCKYINHNTHNKYLKRSQVKGGDLLIKITGVGRMAVSSVAPDGFEGNTNQHMVVVKTENKKTSEILSSYLNTDIGEKLASRRSTGGTRPALDYPALLSIPIIFNEDILKIYDEAILQKKQKEQEAEDLLNSIDYYILNKLGLVLPHEDDSIGGRVFLTSFNEVSGSRLDSEMYLPYFKKIEKEIENSNFPCVELKKILSKTIRRFTAEKDKTYNYIQLGSIGRNNSEVLKPLKIQVPDIPLRAQQIVKTGEILFSIANPQWGTHIIVKEENNNYIASSGFIILSSSQNNEYIVEVLRSSIYKKLYEKYLTGSGLFLNISIKDLLSIKIPIPEDIDEQTAIVKHISDIRERAKELLTEGNNLLVDAKIKIEKLILGI